MMRWSLYAIAFAGCGTSSGSQTVTASAVVESSAERAAVIATVAPEAPCTDPAVIVEAGRERGLVCPDAAAGRGLVIVDLQDAWTPRLFSPQPSGTVPSYRATYLALREIDPNVPVLLMSGHTLNENVQEILDLGVRNFVSKPYSISALAKAIAELIQ